MNVLKRTGKKENQNDIVKAEIWPDFDLNLTIFAQKLPIEIKNLIFVYRNWLFW